jgi:hypothetical protein
MQHYSLRFQLIAHHTCDARLNKLGVVAAHRISREQAYAAAEQKQTSHSQGAHRNTSVILTCLLLIAAGAELRA